MTDSMEVLGWTLLHFCWQAAVIALVYRVVDLSLPTKARSNMRYSLALVALLGMFAISLGTFTYEEIRAAKHGVSLQTTVPQVTQRLGSNLSSLPVAGTRLITQAGQHIDLAEYTAQWMPWLDAAWLLGVLVLSVRTVGGWWLIQRLRRSGLAQIPESVRSSLVNLSHRMNIRRQIDLRISGHISGPLTMGVFRSLILLPVSTLTALNAEQIEVVLAHELAHIRRADYLWNMLQSTIETLFFFHPAVWWVSNKLRQQRELCCDDVALACCSDPLVYATALLRLEEQRGSRLHLAMALDGHQTASGLRARIVRILGETPQGRREIAPLSLLGVCAMLGLFLFPLQQLFAGFPVEAKQAVKVLDVAVVAPSPSPKIFISPLPVERPAVRPSHVACLDELPPQAHVASAAHALSQVAAAIAAPVAAQSAPVAAANVSQKSDYIAQMRAAGYDVDVDKFIAMKVQAITPQFAQSMGALGFGKPTADELISLKIFGVTPETVKELRASGLDATSFQDLVSYRIFKVTPEFAAGMKDAGFSNIPAKKLVELRVQDVTPEFARAAKQQFSDVTAEQLVQLRIFHIDEAFIASAQSQGFDHLTIDKLVKLRISGLLDDSSQRSEK
ncbi:MAG TPA: M56 family metallopeptidase [Edaphobacter sp.]|nr:M56 family metallopeptidase [Edaphobacter sp.]